MYQTDVTGAPEPAARPEGAGAPPPACRCCAAAGAGSPARSGKRAALWWSLGGTLLSGLGFVALMLFEQYNASLTELRNDLKHFHECRAELVTKESFRKM